MAIRPGQNEAERNELFAIVAKEAERLEQLTTDFLAYARPRALQASGTNVCRPAEVRRRNCACACGRKGRCNQD